jgi:succinate dehydrogenase/fumarate reductase cytochrome b subunit
VQAISGTAFSTFLFGHIVNTLFAHTGIDGYEEVQRFLRIYYQNTFVEPILILGSIGVHSVANIIIASRRWEREKNPKAVKPLTWAQKINRYTGYFLGAVIPAHIIATRLPGLLKGSDYQADFPLITFTLQKMGAIFVPYYIALGISGLYHMTYGLLQSSDRLLGTKLARKSTEGSWFLPLMVVGAAAITSAVFAFRGNYFDVFSERLPFWANQYNRLFALFGVKTNFKY